METYEYPFIIKILLERHVFLRIENALMFLDVHAHCRSKMFAICEQENWLKRFRICSKFRKIPVQLETLIRKYSVNVISQI